MDSSPAKRRKLSPTKSLPLSTLKSQQKLIGQDGGRLTSHRPLYMSPTKASLARFNPHLLPRSTSVEFQKPDCRAHPAGSRRARTADYIAHFENGENTRSMGARVALNGITKASKRDKSTFAHGTPSKLPRSETTKNAADHAPNAADPVTPTQKDLGAVSAAARTYESREPSLPSTPSQLGLEPPPEKPKGLLFYSPSKRPSRIDRSMKKTSPLKPRDLSPQPTAPFGNESTQKLGPPIYTDSAPKPAPSQREVENAARRASLRQLEVRLNILQEDLTKRSMLTKWHEDDAKWKKRSTKQKREVSKVASEILKLQAGSGDAKMENSKDTNVLQTRTISQCLAQFLPFSGIQRTSAPKRLTTIAQAADDFPDNTDPFTIKVSNSTCSIPSASSLLVRQDVEVSTPEHSMVARLRIMIAPTSQVISDIRVLGTTASTASELAPWLQADAKERTSTSIGKSIGQYLEESSLRTRCWTQCMNEYPGLVKAITETHSRLEEAQFLSHGGQSLCLERSSANVAIEWHISFTDDGDVDSKISSKTSVPEAWKELPGGHELGRIDEAFDGLVREKGVTEAIRAIARILFPP